MSGILWIPNGSFVHAVLVWKESYRTISGRKPWFGKFRAALAETDSFESVEELLRGKVVRWRGGCASREKWSEAEEEDSMNLDLLQ